MKWHSTYMHFQALQSCCELNFIETVCLYWILSALFMFQNLWPDSSQSAFLTVARCVPADTEVQVGEGTHSVTVSGGLVVKLQPGQRQIWGSPPPSSPFPRLILRYRWMRVLTVSGGLAVTLPPGKQHIWGWSPPSSLSPLPPPWLILRYRWMRVLTLLQSQVV